MSTETTTRCAVVGGGPGGVVLAYLLARAGVPVTLLESRPDFDRRFRGDALAPPVLEVLDDLGLADPLLAAVRHGTADTFVWRTPTRAYRLADYRRASAKYPYYALVPQGRFLPFVVQEAARFPGFRVEMGARASALLRDGGGRVVGVEYTRGGARQRLHADLVVGADGRNSKIRTLSTVTATELGAHLDICWYEVPRRDVDPPLSGLGIIAEPGASLAVLGQADSWQLGYLIPAGTFPALRAGGIGPVVGAFRRRLPWLRDRLDGLSEVNQLTLLPVRITSVDRWSEPGLLLIGRARHLARRRERPQLRGARRGGSGEPAGRAAAGRSGRPGGGGCGDRCRRGRPPPVGRPRPAAAEARRARCGAPAAHRRSTPAARPAGALVPSRRRPAGRAPGCPGARRTADRRPDPASGGRPALTAARNAVGCTARAAIPAVAGPRR